MNQYFYLKIKKRKNIKLNIKFNNFILDKIITKKTNLKIFKKKNGGKFKFKSFIFFCRKKLKFKSSFIILKFSLNNRKFNLWEKIDYWFHIYFFYNKKKWEDHTVFINFLESIKCFNTLYYLYYTKKKLLEGDGKLFIEEKKNIKFWIWIFNVNTNFTAYFHNAKSFLYRFIKYKNYKFSFFKKNFVRYNLSLLSLKALSYILEEDYKEKTFNSSKSKLNSEVKRLFYVWYCVKNNLKNNNYISYFSFYFKIKWKLMYYSYVAINDLRTTKILYFWLFRYLLFYIIETFFKHFKIRLSVFYYNIDSFKCFSKLLKFKKVYFKKKNKKKTNTVFSFDVKFFVKDFLNLIVLVVKEIFSFFFIFVDKYLYNDFKKVLKDSKIYIYPELKILFDYIKKFFKR